MTLEQQEKMIKLLAVLFPTATIYLFGSRARGTHSVTSDVDVAINAGKRISGLDLVQARNIIEALNISQTVDLADFHALPKNMQDTILKEGIIWKQ